MNRAEFINEISRLYRGFNRKPEVELTHERVEAMWDKYSRIALNVLRMAVDDLLRGFRFPSQDALDKSIQAHVDAFAGPSTPGGRTGGGFRLNGSFDPYGTMDTAFGKFLLDLVALRNSKRWAPAMFGEIIKSSKFSHGFGPLQQWFNRTELSHWPGLITSTAAMEYVKRCGYPAGPGYWEEDPAQVEQVRQLGIARHEEWPEVVTGRWLIGENPSPKIPEMFGPNAFEEMDRELVKSSAKVGL